MARDVDTVLGELADIADALRSLPSDEIAARHELLKRQDGLLKNSEWI